MVRWVDYDVLVLPYLDVMALVQLPSVERGYSLLRVLWGKEIYEGETLGELRGFIERVRQPVLSNCSRSAEDLSHHSSELLVLLLSHLQEGHHSTCTKHTQQQYLKAFFNASNLVQYHPPLRVRYSSIPVLTAAEKRRVKQPREKLRARGIRY